jgi:uncharacterized membrane protein
MTAIGTRIAPPRFILFGVLLAIAVPAGVAGYGWSHGLLAGFDVAAAVFLLSLVPLFHDHGAAAMRRRSRDNDANRTLLLAVTAVVTIAVLTAIAAELGAKEGPRPPVVALIIGSLALCWMFSNAVYALHYAHVFYDARAEGGDTGGLDFPRCDEPDYWDFAYFAFTLGMTFQTSDVSVTTRSLRKVALFHCLAAFVFNIGVLAFTVNVLGN